jgi:hypothetical protein
VDSDLPERLTAAVTMRNRFIKQPSRESPRSPNIRFVWLVPAIWIGCADNPLLRRTGGWRGGKQRQLGRDRAGAQRVDKA